MNSNEKVRYRHHGRTAALALLLLGVLLSAPLLAAGELIRFDIGPQKAASALIAAGQQGRMSVLLDDRARDVPLRGVRGYFTMEQAIEKLLEGTGLEYRFRNGSIIVAPGAAVRAERPRRPMFAGLAAFVAALATAPPVSAQTGQPVILEEIVVTAQRRAQSLEDVPISVSVVSGEALDIYGIHDLGAVAARLPSVNVSQVPGSDSINIRGLGSGNNLGFEQSVATFVDGNYRSRSRASRFAFFDIERVEVLRGPQTTFFGNNAIAGALNITTRRPGDALEYSLSGLYAPGDEEYSLEGAVSVPVSDEIAVRLAARTSGMDGYIDNDLTGDEGPDLDEQIGRLSFRWTPGSIVELDGRIDVAESDNTGTYHSELVDCPAAAAFGAPRGACARHLAAGGTDDDVDHETVTGPSYFDYELFETVLQTTIHLENHDIKALTGYYEHDYDMVSNVLPSLNGSVVGTVSGLPTRSREDFEQFSQEIRLESTGQGRLDYMIGAYYSDGDLDVPTISGFYFAAPFALSFNNEQSDEVVSAFAAATVHLRPDTRLNLGLRYSRVEKSVHRTAVIGLSDDSLADGSFVPLPDAQQAPLLGAFGADTGDFADPHRGDDELMPAVALEYDLSPDTMVYASYTRGFKAGGYSVGMGKDEFEPETVDAFEIGFKGAFLDRRATLGVAAFWSEYQDLQETSFILLGSGVPDAIIGNAAESVSQGVELSGALQVTAGLRLTAALAYLSSEYESYPNGPCTSLGNATVPGCVTDLEGKERAYSPELSGSIGLSYRRALTPDLELTLDSNVYYTDEYFTQANADPLSIQDSYTKWDARIGLGAANGRWEIALVGTNLSDATTFAYWSPLPSSPGSGQVLTERPRSVALQASLRY